MLPYLKQLSKDSIIYGVGGAAVRYTSLILLPIYTRAFGPGGNGLLAGVNNLSTLLLAVVALGLDGAAPLLYFETDDAVQKRRICSLWVALSVLVSAPLAMLLIIFADWVSLLATGTTENADLFKLGAAVLPFSLLQVVFSSILRLAFRPRMYAVLNFSLTTAIAIISIYLVVFLNMGLPGALWAALAGNLIISVVGAWAVRDVIGWREALVGALPAARRLVRLGAPLVPASVSLWIISFSNTYFLIQLAGNDAAGIYRVGSQLAALLGLGIFAFQLAWTPFSLSLARNPDAPGIYARVAVLYTAGAVGASVLLAALSPILIKIIATQDFSTASSVIGLQALAAAALGAYYVVAIGVNLAQRTGQIAWTTIVSAVLNVGLNALLIPVWGITGAGLAFLAANLTSTSLVYLVSQRVYPLPYQPFKLLVIWLIGLICVALAEVANVVLLPPIWLSILFTLLLAGVYLVALLAASIISPRELAVAWDALMGAVLRRVRAARKW